jgi:tellurite resistance protein
MHEEDLAIIKALVPVAWADGTFADKERETIEALLDAFAASDAEKEQIREYAKQRRTLEDIDLQELSADDRRAVVQHAVLISYVDGEHGPEEKQLIDGLISRLKIPAEEAKPLLEHAHQRAKKYLQLLQS